VRVKYLGNLYTTYTMVYSTSVLRVLLHWCGPSVISAYLNRARTHVHTAYKVVIFA
jgi:hypothetical protein